MTKLWHASFGRSEMIIDEGFDLPRDVVDQHDNRHSLVAELSRGGQGVVYRTEDANLAVKIPFEKIFSDEDRVNVIRRYQLIRSLPIPRELPVALPLAVLDDDVGYVMQLLSEMESFHSCFENVQHGVASSSDTIPRWLEGVSDPRLKMRLWNYARSGSTKRRLFALAQIASVLSQLHTRGMVYGDLSPNNCFVGRGDNPKIALIDLDNLRYEQLVGGQTVFTPGYGAPEVVQRVECSRPRTDTWSFAVLAFDSLTLQSPFNGMLFEAMEAEEPGWDLSTPARSNSSNLTEHAHKGLLPFVDDVNDDSNRSLGGIDRELVFSFQLKRLFQEALGDGRLKPWRRPSLIFFARELFRAHDKSIVCPDCRMSYFLGNTLCPYCECEVPRHVVLSTDKWEMVCQDFGRPFEIPNRLCATFSAVSGNQTISEAVIDFEAQLLTRARGSEPIPSGIFARFQGGWQ